MSHNSPTLDLIISWAKASGQILKEGYGEQHQITFKSDANLVTEIDRRSEELLLGQIRKHFPQHTIIAEESGVQDNGLHACWFIDPLDGTTNYAHNVPIFSVSVAYAENNQIVMGVVYDPMRDECFSAQRHHGAWLNGQPIHVSTTENLIDSLLTTGFPYEAQVNASPNTSNQRMYQNLDYFTRLTPVTQGVRRLGSAALDLCYVACGRFDGYWELKLEAWDIAAGTLIVEEAGGTVTNTKGSGLYLIPPYEILATNPQLHLLMLNKLAPL